jgi:hypothetical protein
MKKLICLIAILTVLGTVYSQEPLSFRNKAMGGIVSDNLDLVYDPIELRFVDTLHLYTNLSNLTSGYEEVFNNITDNELLLGASRQNPFYNKHWLSALVRFNKYKTPRYISMDTDLNGGNDLYGYGEVESQYTQFYDALPPFNELYDLRRSISQKKSSVTKNDGYGFILNNSFLLQNYTLGLKMAIGNWANEYDYTDNWFGTGRNPLSGTSWNNPSFSRSVDEYYLDSNYSRLKWSEAGDFNTINDNPYFRMMASVMKPMWGYELRGDLHFYTINNSLETDDLYKGRFEYFSPWITSYARRYSEEDMFKREEYQDGTGLGLGISARRTFDQQNERRNDGYILIGLTALFSSFDYKDATEREFTSAEKVYDGTGGLVDFERTISNKNPSGDDGTGSVNIFNFVSRLNIPLTDGVYFGIGGYYSIVSSKIETEYTEKIYNITNYERTDGVQNTLDYLRTETFAQTADRTVEDYLTVLTIPVGIEYRFNESKTWAMRFGSVFQYTSQTFDEEKKIKTANPRVVNTVYGDGSSTTTTDPNSYLSYAEHSSESNSNTLLTYGLGWIPTQNLQIDLLTYFDTRNYDTIIQYLKSLRLSFVLKI